jgi:hypothetical protein
MDFTSSIGSISSNGKPVIHFVHVLSQWFESFARRHQHGIAALSALSTTAAVMVALWSTNIAIRATRPRLKARVSIMCVIDQNKRSNSNPSYISLRVTNTGAVSIRLNQMCFSWKVGGEANEWASRPMDEHGDENVAARKYPILLQPNTSEIIMLSRTEQFFEDARKMFGVAKLSKVRNMKKQLHAYVHTDGVSSFRAEVSQSIFEKLHEPS